MPIIADSIGVSISTLRYRIKPYSDFIPCETHNKGDKYSDESEAIIREISAYYDQKKSTEEIMTMLAAKHVRDIVIAKEESTATTTNDQQMMYQQLVRFNDTMEKLVEFMDKQQTMQQDVNDMKVAIGELSRVDRHKKEFWSRLWG